MERPDGSLAQQPGICGFKASGRLIEALGGVSRSRPVCAATSLSAAACGRLPAL